MFRRKAEMPFWLSGFRTVEAYEAREPDWECDDTFGDLDAATEAARLWVEAAGSEAQVEVLDGLGNVAEVRRIVMVSGVEDMS